jgi:beta-glucosidase
MKSRAKFLRSFGTWILSVPVLLSCQPPRTVPMVVSPMDGFILVGGGEFRMGDRYGDRDELPVRIIEVSGFWMADHETTRAEYARFAQASGAIIPWNSEGGEDLPATRITWGEAIRYCDWLSREKGLKPVYSVRGTILEVDWAADGYRLPTEAEWEFAARGGVAAWGKPYSGGSDEKRVGWYYLNASSEQIGKTKAPNELGIYDLSGNVWEWCWDTFGMFEGASEKDPRGAESGEFKVLRGGSWAFAATDMRVSNRYFTEPDRRLDDAGFRPVRSMSVQDAVLLSRAGMPEPAAALEPPPSNARYKDPSLPVKERVSDLLSRMSLEEKAGQMTQAGVAFLSSPQDVADFGLGSVLSGGGMGPEENTPAAWADMTDGLQRAALSSRLGIPILYGIDAVHGHNNVKGSVVYPHNIGLGAAGDEALVERIGAAVAKDLLATGTRWNFAPCVAVPQDERWGRTYEGFGEDSAIVSKLGAAYILGLQGKSLGIDSVAATAKHFLADGGTQGGIDRGNAIGNDARLRSIFLPPYVAAVEAGTATVMASFSSWNGAQMHANGKLLTGLLKNELGFPGVLVSDWAAQTRLPGTPPAQVKSALAAGIDMVMVPDSFPEYRDIVVDLVKSGQLPAKRVDDAVSRILRLKFELGLFEKPFARREFLVGVGSAAQRDLAREAVRKSMVLLKNEGTVLPISARTKTILVTGPAADDVGVQCGGWTISWQGGRGPITRGTTILEGIKEYGAALGIRVIDAVRGGIPEGIEKPDLCIAVVGEEPYAEMNGDRKYLDLPDVQKLLIEDAKRLGSPLVLILISGRPLAITKEIEKSDAFIAAWLPGTEGNGVADVLFGFASPMGRLSYTWPRDIGQIPINAGDGQVGLYPLGSGLSY